MKISTNFPQPRLAAKLRKALGGTCLTAAMLLTTRAAQAQCGSNPDFVVFPDSSGTPSLVFVINETVTGVGGDGIGTIVMGSSTGSITQTQVLQIGPSGNVVPDNSDGCGSDNTAGVYLDKTGILEMLGGFIQPINFTISGPEAADVATGGVLKGFGTVQSGGDFNLDFDVQNGTVNPAGGVLNLSASEDTIQLTNSRLKVMIGAPTTAFLNIMNGGINFTNTKLVVDFPPGFTVSPGQVFTLVQMTGGTRTGLLQDAAGADLNEGDIVSVNGHDLKISYTGGTSGQDILLKDDTPVTISVNNPTAVTEGNTGTVNVVFNITLSAPSSQTVTVNYATANGTAQSSAPADYGVRSGTRTFAPGQVKTTVSIPVVGDTRDEVNETLFLNLSGATNAAISDGQGQATITDDDAPPSLSINDLTVTEGNAGNINAVFTVTLSAASGQTVTVNYTTANGTAQSAAPTDYGARTGTLTFAPGLTSKTITVPVVGDTRDEANETFVVNLSAAGNATIADAQGQCTITDDDATPSLTINNRTVTEGNVGNTNMVFTVTLSAVSGRTVTVNYATANGTAQSTSPTDYGARTGTLTFAPGQTSKTITVPVVGDTRVEVNETFFVNLSAATNATIADGQGLGTITNDDVAPLFAPEVEPSE